MHLFDIFKKQGIQDISDLTPDERKTYEQWTAILNKPDPTIEDLKALLPKELERANIELRKHENSKGKEAFYKAYTTLCDFILRAVASPWMSTISITCEDPGGTVDAVWCSSEALR